MAAGERLDASATQADADLDPATASAPRAVLDEAWDFPADPVEVERAREYVRGLAHKVIGYGDRAEDVRLVAAEILTNAVLHGDGHTIYVRVFTTDTAIRVEVRDGGRADSPYIPETPLNDHGRGLTIVEAFTDRWGAMREAYCLCVWFEVNFETRL